MMKSCLLEDELQEKDSVKLGLLLVQGCSAARASDNVTLANIMQEFNGLATTTMARLTFLACVLDNLPDTETDIRAQLLADFKKLQPEREIEFSLCAARNAAQIGNVQDVVKYFFTALTLADNLYKQAWPDIADALAKKDFVCALQHYALHGKSEGRGWHDLWHFFFALQAMQDLLPLLAESHMRLYEYDNKELAERMINSLME